MDGVSNEFQKMQRDLPKKYFWNTKPQFYLRQRKEENPDKVETSQTPLLLCVQAQKYLFPIRAKPSTVLRMLLHAPFSCTYLQCQVFLLDPLASVSPWPVISPHQYLFKIHLHGQAVCMQNITNPKSTAQETLSKWTRLSPHYTFK